MLVGLHFWAMFLPTHQATLVPFQFKPWREQGFQYPRDYPDVFPH
jgi:hypothetical protein